MEPLFFYQRLPQDAKDHIASFLDYQTLLKAARVNRDWYNTHSKNQIWKRIALQFHHLPATEKPSNEKQLSKNHNKQKYSLFIDPNNENYTIKKIVLQKIKAKNLALNKARKIAWMHISLLTLLPPHAGIGYNRSKQIQSCESKELRDL